MPRKEKTEPGSRTRSRKKSAKVISIVRASDRRSSSESDREWKGLSRLTKEELIALRMNETEEERKRRRAQLHEKLFGEIERRRVSTVIEKTITDLLGDKAAPGLTKLAAAFADLVVEYRAPFMREIRVALERKNRGEV